MSKFTCESILCAPQVAKMIDDIKQVCLEALDICAVVIETETHIESSKPVITGYKITISLVRNKEQA